MNKSKITLTEELKKFKALCEYDFYVPESYEETSNNLLGEEEPADEEDSIGDSTDFENKNDSPEDVAPEEDGPIDFSGDDSADLETNQNTQSEPVSPPVDDAVELDVTELVQGTKDAKASADLANKQLAQLTQKFDQLLSTASKIDLVNQKIDSLEHEVEKRNPTEVEKLEMRSLDSFPFNIKLTDYWSSKEGQYDVMHKSNEKEEYVLTQNDVDKDFNDLTVRDSFEEFDEEDI